MRILIGNRELSAEIDHLHTALAIAGIQLDKVREIRSMINRIIITMEAGAEVEAENLAKSIVNNLNQTLGDDDD